MLDHAFAVRSIMKRYRVLSHYRARTKVGKPQYAVFTGSGKTVCQVFGPAGYAESTAACVDLITRDLLEYFGHPATDEPEKGLG